MPSTNDDTNAKPPGLPVAEAVTQFVFGSDNRPAIAPTTIQPTDSTVAPAEAVRRPTPRRRSRRAQPRAPPNPADIDAMSIRDFCQRHGISMWLYFELQKAGRGPRVMRVGRGRVLISREAAERWRRGCERDALRTDLRQRRAAPASTAAADTALAGMQTKLHSRQRVRSSS